MKFNWYIGWMKKFIVTGIFFWLTLQVKAQIEIQMNPQFVLEGKVTSKKGNKLMANAPISVYGFDMMWVITTNATGNYRLDLSVPGQGTKPPLGIDGKDLILFYYSEKRKYAIPTKDINFGNQDPQSKPVVHWDVKL